MRLKLLTVGNPKTRKGEEQKYMTFILHLAPAKVSGFEMCPGRSPGCTFACLNTAGRGGIFAKGKRTNTIQQARIRRTKYFVLNRQNFMNDLLDDIVKAIAYAESKGFIPVFRLNGTSDVRWEDIRVSFSYWSLPNVFEVFPNYQFYDYTKILGRKVPKNYHLTFSRSENNTGQCPQAFAQGMNVSVVFHGPMPKTFGRPVINGDESDLRFLDPKGVIVGLKAKGRAKKDKTGFVIRTEV